MKSLGSVMATDANLQYCDSLGYARPPHVDIRTVVDARTGSNRSHQPVLASVGNRRCFSDSSLPVSR
jgi:hypothetical protein